jgi:hypothetical protein
MGNRVALENEYWNFAVDVLVLALHISEPAFIIMDIFYFL